ncbi:MAG: ABC transporter ATP-binding protein [Anaerolineales bacterium]|nr:ABC transporter ATP-binding protein [Anaerolineales bacterium]
MAEHEVILQMNKICKAFDTNQALDNVNFELGSREILGLLGGNGAGKTTLMNVLYGLYRQDSGEIILKGKKISISSPGDAIRHGIGMVHQHFLQINNFPVIQNIILGTPVKERFTMNLTAEKKKVAELCDRFAISVDLDADVGDLPMGTRQKVEILKALYRGIDILILDEPTTNLTPQEVDALFQTLRVMVEQGLSIVFITHKLREVLSVADRITLLRNGKNVAAIPRSEASEEALVWGMVGEDMDVKTSVIFSKEIRTATRIDTSSTPLLDVDNISLVNEQGITRLKDVSFQIYPGEIFGIAGVAGNGQSELAEALVGIQPLTRGKVRFNGEEHAMLTAELLEKGLTYIPEDRLEDGYLPKANVAQNLILGAHRKQPYSNKGIIDWKKVFAASWQLIKEYNIKTGGPQDTAANLSGGNIQRVMVARAFAHAGESMIIAHCPTRGLDLPSMDFVYKKMLERKSRNLATLLISEDLDELLLLCDRIGVLYRGELVGILSRDQFDKYEIGRMMSGVND